MIVAGLVIVEVKVTTVMFTGGKGSLSMVISL